MAGDNSTYEEIGYRDSGLPNITARHEWTGVTAQNIYSGAFTGELTGSGYTWNASRYYGLALNFDASLSNPIYGNSEIVQPPAYIGGYYVCYA